jgi:hypothetical protein
MKTRWISMLSLAIWILTKYKTVMIEIFHEQVSHDIVKKSLEFFFDVVATLTSGSRSRQGLTKVRVENEARKSHFMLQGVQKNVRE